MHTRTLSIVLAVFITSNGVARADEAEPTPVRFRGENGQGVYKPDVEFPLTWTDDDYAWRIDLPGGGHSSPIPWRDRVYVTFADATKGDTTLMCLALADGRELWRKTFDGERFRQHRYNSYAAASPAADEHHVYLSWVTPEHYRVAALSHDGREVWRADLGPFQSQHGFGASPMVYRDLLVVPNDQLGPSALIAFDRMSGATRWKLDRPAGRTAYGTPSVFTDHRGKELLLVASQSAGVSAIDPAAGKLEWELGGVFRLRALMGPQLAGGLIFASCGSGGGGNYVVAVRPPAAPGQKPTLAYTIDRNAPYVPQIVSRGEMMFLVSDGGIISAVHAPTGEVKWRERLGGDAFASPVLIHDRVYATTRDGRVIIFKASADAFEKLGEVDLGETSYATPVVVGDVLLLRTETKLMCLRGAPQQSE